VWHDYDLSGCCVWMLQQELLKLSDKTGQCHRKVTQR
jgi:hypothetical protein